MWPEKVNLRKDFTQTAQGYEDCPSKGVMDMDTGQQCWELKFFDFFHFSPTNANGQCVKAVVDGTDAVWSKTSWCQSCRTFFFFAENKLDRLLKCFLGVIFAD